MILTTMTDFCIVLEAVRFLDEKIECPTQDPPLHADPDKYHEHQYSSSGIVVCVAYFHCSGLPSKPQPKFSEMRPTDTIDATRMNSKEYKRRQANLSLKPWKRHELKAEMYHVGTEIFAFLFCAISFRAQFITFCDYLQVSDCVPINISMR